MMDFINSINPLYSMSGFAVGMLVGLTGVGGGSLMTPLLILLFGIHPATAVGTDLLMPGDQDRGHRCPRLRQDRRLAHRRAARHGQRIATAGVLVLFYFLGMQGKVTSSVIQTALGCTIFVTALALIFRTQIVSLYAHRMHRVKVSTTRNLTIAMGFILGILVSLTSVGAGAIGVTALIMLYPDLPTPRIVGSDIAHAVPLTLIAGSGYWIAGAVDFHLMVLTAGGLDPGHHHRQLFCPAHARSGAAPASRRRPHPCWQQACRLLFEAGTPIATTWAECSVPVQLCAICWSSFSLPPPWWRLRWCFGRSRPRSTRCRAVARIKADSRNCPLQSRG